MFNEGWGQYDTLRVVEKAMALDSTRLFDCASGWVDFEVRRGSKLGGSSVRGVLPPAAACRALLCIGVILLMRTWCDATPPTP